MPDGQALLGLGGVPASRQAALLRRLGLTGREAEVLLLLTDGHTIAASASKLDKPSNGREAHAARISKLGLDNRVAATEPRSPARAGLRQSSRPRSRPKLGEEPSQSMTHPAYVEEPIDSPSSRSKTSTQLVHP